MTADVEKLLDHLQPGRRIAVITGAGCSTSSGIGDYRDERGGWKRPAPVQMQDFVKQPGARQRYWARSMLGWPMMSEARPNAAHRALVALESYGVVSGLVTQNVDGLHQQAGHRQVLELHGALATVVCLDCGGRASRQVLQGRLERDNPDMLGTAAAAAPDGDADLAERADLTGFVVPDCERCGGVLKPDVVFYGDSVPKARVAAGHALVESAEAVLIVGSSLMVFSSFRFCRHAHQLGIPLVAINRGVTRADDWLAVKVDDDCSRVLPELVAALAPRAPP
ncbi:MAG: NAD-dependent protein deacetylase [Pseudomonadales bacterium]